MNPKSKTKQSEAATMEPQPTNREQKRAKAHGKDWERKPEWWVFKGKSI